MASTSPTSRALYLENPPLRDSIISPRAMPAEENTEIVVSAPVFPFWLMRLMSSAHRMPNTSRLTVSFRMPRSSPRPTPARALWPRASEKNAIFLLTAMVPSSPKRGVSISSARRAFFMKPYLNI